MRNRLEKNRSSLLSHVDEHGAARMVDVGGKPESERVAVARGMVRMKPATLRLILAGGVAKGNVIETARLAGIMAAKRTSDLIPLCHPLNLTHVQVEITPKGRGALEITSEVRVFARTGVEMEALTAVAVAALTIYDMCKSADRAMVIGEIHLLRKSGGTSGAFQFPEKSSEGRLTSRRKNRSTAR